MAVAVVDDVEMGYCDSNSKRPEPKTRWIKKLLEDDPQHLDWYTGKCLGNQQDLREATEDMKKRFNKTGMLQFLHIFKHLQFSKH